MKKGIVLFLAVVFIAVANVGWSAEHYVENTKCGKPFPVTDSWAEEFSYDFAYEVMNKGKKGFKVKTLAKVKGEMIHLECARELPSADAARQWLLDNGYEFQPHGPEKNYPPMMHSGSGPIGIHGTADRGPLTKVPQRVIKN